MADLELSLFGSFAEGALEGGVTEERIVAEAGGASGRGCLAVVLSALNLFALRVLMPLKERIDERHRQRNGRGRQEPPAGG